MWEESNSSTRLLGVAAARPTTSGGPSKSLLCKREKQGRLRRGWSAGSKSTQTPSSSSGSSLNSYGGACELLPLLVLVQAGMGGEQGGPEEWQLSSGGLISSIWVRPASTSGLAFSPSSHHHWLFSCFFFLFFLSCSVSSVTAQAKGRIAARDGHERGASKDPSRTGYESHATQVQPSLMQLCGRNCWGEGPGLHRGKW